MVMSFVVGEELLIYRLVLGRLASAWQKYTYPNLDNKSLFHYRKNKFVNCNGKFEYTKRKFGVI